MSFPRALPETDPGPEADRAIRARRSAKVQVDPWRPLGVVVEQERGLDGSIVPTVTIFLAGSECPFTCVFCDLWRATLDEPTPSGALPRQIERGLEEAGELPRSARLKLYNASNFFEPRAVPTEDLAAIAELARPFSRLVIECHPKLVGESCADFAHLVEGRLEVAMGLETVHPEAMPRLNKRMNRHDYDRAAGFLKARTIAHRSFVLVGAPFVPDDGLVDWTVISAAYALDRGAETITLIPVRVGGELDELALAGWFRRPRLDEVEAALERSLDLPAGAVVQLDLWDLERLADCPECFTRRRARLERINLAGETRPRVDCPRCSQGPA